LVDKRKLASNDRQALQELSFDVVNCLATLKQINHLADINGTDNLRSIAKRLPDRLMKKKKNRDEEQIVHETMNARNIL
jgi:hypothetical protein